MSKNINLKDLPIEKRTELMRKLTAKRNAGGAPPAGIQPVKRDSNRLPLSHAQQRLWFINRMDGQEAAFNLADCIVLKRPFEIAVLEKALNALINRHEILRTTFGRDEAVQVIHPHAEQRVTRLEPNDSNEDARRNQVSEVAAKLLSEPFDLVLGPLFRQVLLGDKWLFCFHHMIYDVLSAEVFHREMGILLEAFSKDQGARLPKMPIQYGDYAVRQRERLTGERLERLQAFWKAHLGAEPPDLQLPLDFSRPAVQDTRCRRIVRSLPTDLSEQVRSFNRTQGITLFTTTLTTFYTLLYRYSGQAEISIATVTANRDQPELEHLIGFFVNTLVLKADLSGTPSFIELLERVKRLTAEAFRHQELPFEMLVEALQPKRDLSRNPLAQAMLVMDGADEDDAGIELDTVHATFDLTLRVVDGPVIELAVEYATALFAPDTAERLADHFTLLMREGITRPETALAHLPMLGDAERRRLLEEWSGTAAPSLIEPCLHRLFEKQVARTPEAIAVWHDGEALSFAELNDWSNRLANYLSLLGCGPETPVALCLDRSSFLPMAMLAVLKAGGAYVPLDPAYPTERIAFMLTDSRARVVLTLEKLLPVLPETGGVAMCLDSERSDYEFMRSDNPCATVFGGNLAYTIYTSGSTGRPKGVAIAHQNAAAMLDWGRRIFSPESRRAVLAATSICFDLSVYELMLPLCFGGAVVMAENALSLSVMDFPISLLNTVPSAAAGLLAANGIPRSVQTINLAGEPLKPELVDRLYALGHVDQVNDLYGPSEDTTYSTHALRRREGVATVGRPITGTRAYLLDDAMHLSPIGVPGELFLAGAGVTRGYHQNPDLTAGRYVPDPYSLVPGGRLYRTGDLMRYLPDGNLQYLGRIDQQVKVRGFRVELGEIESVLNRQAGVKEAAVVVCEDRVGAKRILAYVSGGAEPQVLREQLLKTLPAHMAPERIIRLDALPLTPNGKTDRRALMRRAADDLAETSTNRAAHAAPRNTREALLVDIWRQVLHVEHVSVFDNFFELGGHSILSIQIVSRANRAGLHLTMNQIFSRQTVAGQAEVARDIAPAVETEQGMLEGPVPLSPVQQWFFGQNFVQPHHWNQAQWLQLAPAVADEAVLRAALTALWRRHDMLRAVYSDNGQAVCGGEPPFEVVAVQDAAERLARAECLQAGLSLEQGPVVRFAFFPGEPNHLLIVAHHLVIDGVSWRILLEDLERALVQLSQGRTPDLGEKGSSFRQWVDHLNGQPDPEPVTVAPTALPYDFPEADDSVGDSVTLSVSLDAAATQALLRETGRAYHTRADALMIAALFQAFHMPRLALTLEHHGRSPVPETLDISRTVGWFTRMIPVSLEPADKSPAGLIKYVKEQTRAADAPGPPPNIAFNYLGEFDAGTDHDSLVRLLDEPVGADQGAANHRPFPLEINAAVTNNVLTVNWTYGGKRFKSETIQNLADRHLAALRTLIDHCRQPDHFGYTPSDFPLAGLNQTQLDSLIGAEPNVDDLYPLTPLQEGLLFHGLLDPDSAVYRTQFCYTFTPQPDVNALEKAWRLVAERHEILRSVFPWQNLERPLQKVLRGASFTFERCDWREKDPRTIADDLDVFLAQERGRGFDFEKETPMRLCWLALPAAFGGHRLVWTHHHMLLDAWSLSVILDEVISAHDAIRMNETPNLPARTGHYRDFIEWLERRDKKEAEAFWRTNLTGFEAATPLTIGTSAGETSGDRIHESELVLSAELSSALNELGRRRGLTANTLAQAAWSLLLSHYSGQDDVLFGVTVSGRPSELPGVEQMAGLFINTLPFRARLRRQTPVVEWLQEVQNHQLNVQHHGFLPLVEIHALSPVPGDEPLFESILVFESRPNSDRDEAATRLSDVTGFERTDYPLTLSAAVEERFFFKLEYDSARFDEATIDLLFGHLRALLSGIARKPDAPLSALSPLSDNERENLLHHWNGRAYDQTIDTPLHHLFEAAARQYPAAKALSQGARKITYGALDRAANQLANRLRRENVGVESVVAIRMAPAPELLVAVLAVLKAGAAFLPIDPDYPAERLRYMLEDAGAAVLLTRDDQLESTPSLLAPVISLDHDFKTESDQPPATTTTPEQGAWLFYTSGSTGKPKGALTSHAAAASYALMMRETLAMTERDRILQLASISFDVLLEEILPPLISGGTVVFPTERAFLSGDALQDLIEEQRITGLELSAAHWHQWVDDLEAEKSAPPLCLRFVIVGCERIHPERYAAWRNFGVPLLHVYGLTETAVTSTIRALDVHMETRDQRSLFSIGRPVDNTRIYITRDGALQPVGIPGELLVSGQGLARGYLQRPELTAERFRPDPFATEAGARCYHTGDLARFLPDGNIEYLGRADQQVKLRGYRIELGEIESALRELDAVRDCAVIVRGSAGDTAADRYLAAYLVAHEGQTPPEAAALRAHLSNRLPEYMVPAAFVPLEQLPLTVNGKLDRKALPEPTVCFRSDSAYLAPRSAGERAIAEIWAQVLKLERVGVHDDFFRIGGHSLLATQVISRLRRHFKTALPIRVLFEASTVASLAARLEALSETTSEQPPPLTPISRNDAGPIPLSFAQERLWFLDQLQPGNTAYNITEAYRLTGVLDRKALQKALVSLINRHQALRTVFKLEDDTPCQVIQPSTAIDVNLVQVRDEQEAHAAVLKEGQTPFDLTGGPLFRVKLLELSPHEHILVLCMHHIISDGWSIALITQEITELYRAHLQDVEPQLTPLPIQYADYAVWQRQWLSGEVLARELAFWRERLHDVTPSALLTDHPRPARQTYRGAGHDFELPPMLGDNLKALAQQHNATLFMTLLAAFKTLLQRYSGQTDICVGTPIANRTMAETEPLIGFFANTLALRSDLSGEPDFIQLLDQVRSRSLEAFAHQDTPFEKVVEAVGLSRDMSRPPLFQIMFSLENTPPPEKVVLPDLSFEPWDSEAQTAQFDLTLNMAETEGVLRGGVIYNVDLFEAATIKRLSGSFLALLTEIAADPKRSISEFSLLDQSARRQLLHDWNDTQTAYDLNTCMQRLIERQTQASPMAAALEFEDQRLSYAELAQRTDGLAAHLRNLGVGPEKMVAVCAERSIEMVVGLLAVMKAGGAYVPLDPTYPAERLSYMLADCGAELLLAQRYLIENLPHDKTQLVDLNTVYTGQAPVDRSLPEQPVYVIFTSGSTGKPKGVLVSHGALVNRLLWMQVTYRLTPEDRVLQKTPYGFDVSVWEFFWPLFTGARLIVALPEAHKNPDYLVRLIRERHVSVMHFVPSMLSAFLAAEDVAACTCLRAVFCSGEALPPATAYTFHELLPKTALHNLYGPTEAAIDVTFQQVRAREKRDSIPIGRPVANTQIHLLDAAMNLIPAGVAGELFIGGVQLARGYLNRPDLSAERFVPDPFSDIPGMRLYKSGDLARRHNDGGVAYLGRTDFQVKLRGFRIELGEIETALTRHHAVKESVVIARTVQNDLRLVAYFTANGEPPEGGDLQTFLRAELPEHMVPAVFVMLDALPLSPNGKVDRKALPEPDANQMIRTEYTAPRDENERKLADLWCELLGLERVGVHDNFFDIGGHSLLATRVTARLHRDTGLDLPLQRFFEHPTIAELAAALSAHQAQPETSRPDAPTITSRARKRDQKTRLAAQLNNMSDAEIKALLAKKRDAATSEKPQ